MDREDQILLGSSKHPVVQKILSVIISIDRLRRSEYA